MHVHPRAWSNEHIFAWYIHSIISNWWLLIPDLTWIGMYTFSTKYIFSGHQSDIVTDVSEGAALKKMKQFQSRRKGNGSIWNFFCCFHLSHRVFHWKLTENFKFLIKREKERSSIDFLWLPEVSESATNKIVKFLILIDRANLFELFTFSF